MERAREGEGERDGEGEGGEGGRMGERVNVSGDHLS